MTAYRSTTLRLLTDHCARALDFAESGAFRDASQFAGGINAHAVLQAIGESGPEADQRAIAESVVRQLVTAGRSFDGIPEPPMNPEQAVQGREIALRYLATHGLPIGARYEQGLAVDRRWQPVPYDSPDAYYRAAIDVIEVSEQEDEEGYRAQVVATTDWKSAWPTSAAELETIQLRGQAAVAWAHYPDATVLIRRAVNLRTGAVYEAETIMDEDGQAQVQQWRRDIEHLIAAAEARGPDGRRAARPGRGCIGCPYLMECPDSRPMRGSSATDLAREWILIEARRTAVGQLLRGYCEETEIDTGDGVVGYFEKSRQTAAPDAPQAIADAWFNGEPPEPVLGLLMALKLGAGNVEAVAKQLHPFTRSDSAWKEERAALLEKCLMVQVGTEFGVLPG